MIRIAVIGLGKMGLSHLAIANGLSGIEIAAIVDSTPLVGAGLSKITGIRHMTSAADALKLDGLDAVIIATPTVSHEQIARAEQFLNLAQRLLDASPPATPGNTADQDNP